MANDIANGLMMVLKLMKIFKSIIGAVALIAKGPGGWKAAVKEGLKAAGKFAMKFAAAQAKSMITGEPNEVCVFLRV